MFSEATQELLKAIASLIKQLASMIQAAGPLIYKSLASVYSVCWEDKQDNAHFVDPVQKRSFCLPERLERRGPIRCMQSRTQIGPITCIPKGMRKVRCARFGCISPAQSCSSYSAIV